MVCGAARRTILLGLFASVRAVRIVMVALPCFLRPATFFMVTSGFSPTALPDLQAVKMKSGRSQDGL